MLQSLSWASAYRSIDKLLNHPADTRPDIMRFAKELEKIASQIPRGRVTTYGQVAKALGDVKAAKAVFGVISRSRQTHRIVNAEGKVSEWQIRLLRDEGIEVGDSVRDMKAHLFTDFRTDFPLKALREEQEWIAEKVVAEDDFEDVELVCGFDLAYDDSEAICAYVVVETGNLEVVEKGTIRMEIDFPYIPGYLAYREFPAIECAHRELESMVDVLLVDGHGIMHPRKAGIACHVGVKLDVPTIGVGKSPLVGRVEVPPEPGSCERVLDGDEMVGHALRWPTSKKPIFVSPGHKVSFNTAAKLVRRLMKSRIPEPLRLAHELATARRG